MLNKFFQKSIWYKLFLMNLLILVSIVASQLIFQAMYFEKYYLSKKREILEKNIDDFKNILGKEYDYNSLLSFIQEVKNKDNVSLSYRDSNLLGGIALESYMGQQHIVMKDNNFQNEYKVVLGKQFKLIDIKNNDNIKVIGTENEYGYIFPQKVFINDIELQTYYEIIPKLNGIQTTEEAQVIPIGKEVYIEGHVEKLVEEDDSYTAISDADLYLSDEEKINILNNESYNARAKNNNSANDILFSSKYYSNGYIIAITPLSEVNDVIGTMNSFYFIIFFIVLILVVVISLIYSRFMTKPLVEMSKMAKRISECDFKYKYEVNREDEIGVLGDSLNSISENLEKSLSELQYANVKLKEDMQMKNIQEDKRKELIANISHELKTPITIIQGSINGIKSGMYSIEIYEDILEETNKMNELVKEMLEISKLESADFKLNKDPFDLYSIFLKEQDKLNSMIREKNLNIRFKGEDEAIVFGDEKRINQVMTNLLTNAIKYTPDGGKIHVSIKLSEDKNQYLFIIENFGVTLIKDELDKIWDAFYRKEKSRNKSFGGTGLGLSIVKRILELHDSDYGVESKENSVKFYFTLNRMSEDDILFKNLEI